MMGLTYATALDLVQEVLDAAAAIPKTTGGGFAARIIETTQLVKKVIERRGACGEREQQALYHMLARVQVWAGPCTYDPRKLKDLPMGMFHCPECGEMVLAGVEHPDYSAEVSPALQSE